MWLPVHRYKHAYMSQRVMNKEKTKQRREMTKKAQEVNIGEMSNFWKIAIACVNPI